MENKIVSFPRNAVTVISPTMRVAVGDYHLPLLTLVRVGDDCYFCLHEKGKLPNPRNMVSLQESTNKKISVETYTVISAAIYDNEKFGGYHVNPHGFLVGYCLAKGVDLYAENLLER